MIHLFNFHLFEFLYILFKKVLVCVEWCGFSCVCFVGCSPRVETTVFRQEALWSDALTLFKCLYCVKEHLIIFTFLQTCIWTKGRKWWSSLMIIATKRSKSKCEDAGIPSADFTKCLWAWQSSVVESMISPYVLSCLLWISSSVLVNLSLMFGSVMDVMVFGCQAAIVSKTDNAYMWMWNNSILSNTYAILWL